MERNLLIELLEDGDKANWRSQSTMNKMNKKKGKGL